MRVGINSLFLIPGEVGGTETYLRETLSAIDREFPDVELILFANRENHGLWREFTANSRHSEPVLLDFPARNRYARIIREQVELPGAVRRSGVDVLWSPGYTAPFYCSCPQVATIHDMQYKTHPGDLGWLARQTTDVLVRLAARRCRRIIAVSQFAKDEIVRFTAAQAGAVDVTHEAAAADFARALSEDERRDALAGLLPDAGPYILSVANSYPHKNLHVLVEAFGRVMSDLPHTLVLVGSPRLGEDALQAALAGLPAQRRVVRLQRIPRAALIGLYQGCDLFAFPSLYEGFGLPVLEAMMAGAPVVAARLASIPEVGGEHVHYVEPMTADGLATAIRKVAGQDAAERTQRTQAARDWAAGFTWERCAAETVASLRRAQRGQRGQALIND